MPIPAVKVTIEGAPIPKARPRVVQGGKHVFTSSSEAENACAKILRDSGYAGRLKGCKRIAVAMRFYGADKRADIDNLAKFYLDAMVKADLIPDDRYVVSLWLERHNETEPARTEIYVGEHAAV